MKLFYTITQRKSTRIDSRITVIFFDDISVLKLYTKPILCCAYNRFGASKCSIVYVIMPKIIFIMTAAIPCIKVASDGL